VSLHTIAAILGVLVFLTIVGLYAWMVRRFGVRRSAESDAERRRALDEYRETLARREQR
jgi:flagellar biogenesis protein FliO